MTHDRTLRLQFVGPVTVRFASDPPMVSRVTQPRQLALLAYLALAKPHGLHSRDVLIALLWPEHDDVRGRQGLRNALHGIRQLIGAGYLISAGDGLIGLDFDRIACDAHALERGDDDGADVIREPLQGFHVTGARDFDAWLERERTRLRALLTARARVGVASRNAARERAVAPISSPIAADDRRAPHRPDAYSFYIRGHYLFLRSAHGGSPDELLRSRDYFERALAVEPTYAPALAGLSNFYAVAARRETLTPFHETFARTIEYSRRVLALDPTLAVPHVHFGVQAWYLEHDIDRAGNEFALAAAKEPTYAEGRRFYGAWLSFVNRHVEALREMEEAARLEPDIPHILSSLAAARHAVGDLAGAESAMRATLQLDPRHGPARERLLRLLEQTDRLSEAVDLRVRSANGVDVGGFRDAWITDGASGYQRAREAELRARANALEERLIEGAPPRAADLFAPPVVQLVSCYALLDERKKARAWQLQAIAQRPVMARWFASVPEIRQLNEESSAL